jgi:tryptophan synthase beta chain
MSARAGQSQLNTYRGGPDERGHFGLYGGRFVAETLMPLILDLERAYDDAKADPKFQAEMDRHLATYVGRPSPLYFAERLTAALQRREDLFQARGAQSHWRAQGEQCARPDHAGSAHGQDAHHRRDWGWHARRCDRDLVRQIRPALYRLHGLRRRRAQKAKRTEDEDAGAEVRAVESGSKTLKDAMNEALRDWVA